MLERITEKTPESVMSIPVGRAAFPVPFPRTLEYNSPAHGTWNIVHIGMAVPQSHSIYVCADNCLRGVVMTAAEMGCMDRFSSVTIRERDIQVDNLETITIEGVSDVIEHLPCRPPVVFVFLVCLHIFVGSDEDYIFRELKKRFPGIVFVKGYMDCVRQKEGPSPDMKLRMAEYTPIRPLPPVPGRVNVLGCDVPFPDDCELMTLLTERGYDVRQLKDLKTFEQFLALGDAEVNICTYPNAYDAVYALSERMECRFAYLSSGVSYEEIRGQIDSLAKTCRFEPPSDPWFQEQEKMCEASLCHLAGVLEGFSVAIDYTAHSRPLGIAKLLLTHGIHVSGVFLDQILPEEEDAFNWLKENYPALELISTVLPAMARYGRGSAYPVSGSRTVALGQKAAWFCESAHFVNMIEGGGLWGYQGIRKLCSLLEEASERELDYLSIIPRKGMGWPSLCAVSSEGI